MLRLEESALKLQEQIDAVQQTTETTETTETCELKDGQSLVCKRKTELGLQKENWIRSVKQGTGWICKSEDWIGSDKLDWIPSLKYEMDL